jgi:toxin ParE1/3/4
MAYRIARAAQADLINIYTDGVEQFGVVQAEKYQDRIEQVIVLIAENPEIARVRAEITPPVRIHPAKSHIIVYLIDDQNVVRILRVRHARENWTSKPTGG